MRTLVLVGVAISAGLLGAAGFLWITAGDGVDDKTAPRSVHPASPPAPLGEPHPSPRLNRLGALQPRLRHQWPQTSRPSHRGAVSSHERNLRLGADPGS